MNMQHPFQGEYEEETNKYGSEWERKGNFPEASPSNEALKAPDFFCVKN